MATMKSAYRQRQKMKEVGAKEVVPTKAAAARMKRKAERAAGSVLYKAKAAKIDEDIRKGKYDKRTGVTKPTVKKTTVRKKKK